MKWRTRRPSSTDVTLVAAPLLWSLHIVGTKYVLGNGFEALPFLVIRFGSAAVIFTIVALIVERTLRVDGRADRLFVGAAALMFVLNQIVFVFALRATTAVTVSLVFGLFPILVAVLAAAIGQDRLTRQTIIAGVASFIGVSLVVIGIPGGASKLSGAPGGVLIALAIPVTWAFFSLLIARPMQRYSPMRINAVMLLATASSMLAVGGSSLDDQDYGAPTSLAWISLAYSTVGALVITNLLWFRAVGQVGAARSSYYLNLQPFGAAILAWILLGETITLIQVAGGAAIALGIAVSRVRTRVVVPLE